MGAQNIAGPPPAKRGVTKVAAYPTQLFVIENASARVASGENCLRSSPEWPCARSWISSADRPCSSNCGTLLCSMDGFLGAIIEALAVLREPVQHEKRLKRAGSNELCVHKCENTLLVRHIGISASWAQDSSISTTVPGQRRQCLLSLDPVCPVVLAISSRPTTYRG